MDGRHLVYKGVSLRAPTLAECLTREGHSVRKRGAKTAGGHQENKKRTQGARAGPEDTKRTAGG